MSSLGQTESLPSWTNRTFDLILHKEYNMAKTFNRIMHDMDKILNKKEHKMPMIKILTKAAYDQLVFERDGLEKQRNELIAERNELRSKIYDVKAELTKPFYNRSKLLEAIKKILKP